jgi:glycosyltransferase involved in cell wall biosynthesis
VIAYDAGGAKDIVVPGKNGILLTSNTVASFAKALKEFDTMSYVTADCINSAARFDREKWKQIIQERITNLWTTKT